MQLGSYRVQYSTEQVDDSQTTYSLFVVAICMS
jgi:hypothetical protein